MFLCEVDDCVFETKIKLIVFCDENTGINVYTDAPEWKRYCVPVKLSEFMAEKCLKFGRLLRPSGPYVFGELLAIFFGHKIGMGRNWSVCQSTPGLLMVRASEHFLLPICQSPCESDIFLAIFFCAVSIRCPLAKYVLALWSFRFAVYFYANCVCLCVTFSFPGFLCYRSVCLLINSGHRDVTGRSDSICKICQICSKMSDYGYVWL